MKDGSRGVFLTDAEARSKGDVYPRLVWPENKQLDHLATEIETLCSELGEGSTHSLVQRFRYYCNLDGPNVPGGGRLAQQFLQEIEDRGAAG